MAQITKEYGVTAKQVRECKMVLMEKSPSLFYEETGSQEESEEMKGIKSLLEAVKNKADELFKDRRLKAVYAAIIAILTALLVYFTAEMVGKNADMARYTKIMSKYTAEMSLYTKELAQLSKNPTLYIYCSIRSNFNFTISDGIQFEAADYLYNDKKVKFYIAVSNKWGSNINSKMDIKVKIWVLNKDKELVNEKPKIYEINGFPINLGPSDITEIFEVQEISKKLSGKDFDWQKNSSFRIVKIEIDNSYTKVHHYKYAGVMAKYFGYDDFKIKYEKFKEKNNKEI